jgi:hypothetical protein
MDGYQNGGEIIGLHNPVNGRSFNQHECCGKNLVAGGLVSVQEGSYSGGVQFGPPGDPEPDLRYETVMKVVAV